MICFLIHTFFYVACHFKCSFSDSSTGVTKHKVSVPFATQSLLFAAPTVVVFEEKKVSV